MNILIDNRTDGLLERIKENKSNWKREDQYLFLERISNEGFCKEAKYLLDKVDQKIVLLNRFNEQSIVPFITQPIIDWNLNLKQMLESINNLPPLYIIRKHVAKLPDIAFAFEDLGPLFYFDIQAELQSVIDFDEVLIEVYDTVLSCFGPIDQISARSRNFRGDRPEPDVILIQINLRNGIEGHIFLRSLDTEISGEDIRLNVYGRDGRLRKNITQQSIDIVKTEESLNYNAYVFIKWVNRACRSGNLMHLKDLNS